MDGVCLIDKDMLDALSAQAAAVPRRRKNRNFHKADGEISHRLLNAFEPGTYIQPHRHADPNKDETVSVLRGKFGLVVFDADGRIASQSVLQPEGPIVGVNIPHGVFHSWVCLAPGSVFYEAKGGPFAPLQPHEKAPWAPPEGAPEVEEYLAKLEELFW
jgi:cupin fold WbuC family metalloprotein